MSGLGGFPGMMPPRGGEDDGMRWIGPPKLVEAQKYLNSLDPCVGPTEYEITEPDVLREHVDPSLPMRTRPSMHWKDCTEQLERWNDPSRPLTPTARAALRRLQRLGELDRWYPDILLKIFLDIDAFLFHGALRGNVILLWVLKPAYMAAAYASPPGRNPVKSPRISLNLNASLLIDRLTPIHEAIEIVIHEAIHAYEMLHCGFMNTKATVDLRIGGPTDGDEHHGIPFERNMRAIQRRIGPTRFMLFTKVSHAPGGTVDIGSKLRYAWDKQGGFMLSDEREEPMDQAQHNVPTREALHRQLDASKERGLARSHEDPRRQSDRQEAKYNAGIDNYHAKLRNYSAHETRPSVGAMTMKPGAHGPPDMRGSGPRGGRAPPPGSGFGLPPDMMPIPGFGGRGNMRDGGLGFPGGRGGMRPDPFGPGPRDSIDSFGPRAGPRGGPGPPPFFDDGPLGSFRGGRISHSGPALPPGSGRGGRPGPEDLFDDLLGRPGMRPGRDPPLRDPFPALMRPGRGRPHPRDFDLPFRGPPW